MLRSKLNIESIVTDNIMAALWAAILFLPFHGIIEILGNDSQLQVSHQVFCVTSIGLVLAGSSLLIAKNRLNQWSWTLPCLLVVSSAYALLSISSAADSWKFILVVAPIGLGILAGILIFMLDSEMRFWTIGLYINLINLAVNFYKFFTSTPDLMSADLGRYGGLIGHPAGLFFPSMILAAVAYSKSRIEDSCKPDGLFLFFSSMLTMLMTGYRSAALGLSISLLSNLRGQHIIKTCHWIMAVACLFGLMAAFTLRNSNSARLASTERSSISRIASVQAGVDSFLSNPIVGMGPGQFVGQADYKHSGKLHDSVTTKGGNLAVHLLSEWGLLGAIPLLVAFLWLGLRLLKAPGDKAGFHKPICLGVLVVFLLDVPIFHFLHPGSTLLFAIWFSLAAYAARLNPESLPYSPSEAKGEE